MAVLKYKIVAKKLPASTLVETLVAVAIIGITISMGLVIFTNIIKSEKNYLKQKATLILQEELEKKESFDHQFEIEGINVIKTIHSFEKSDQLKHLTLIAKDKEGIELAKIQKLIIQKDEE